MFTKEKNEIKEKLISLQPEIIEYQLEAKRMNEEEKCRYSGINNQLEKWPVLNNRYLIVSLLGKGGYSEVYKAYDLENNMEVACKVHQLGSNWSTNLKNSYLKHALRENNIHKQIKHSKVVSHYDTIELDSSSFATILELCPGPDLYTYLKIHKTLPEKEAKMILTQILSGLKYLNELKEKIIHYDLKPQNILLNNGEVKISDFGLSKIMSEGHEMIELTSQGVGTYWYLPPECFETDPNAKINSKVDVWSLGVIFFEMLFGYRPFGQGMTQEKIFFEKVITKAKKVEFPSKPDVSNECKEFIRKCLCYNNLERYDAISAYESVYIKGKLK